MLRKTTITDSTRKTFPTAFLAFSAAWIIWFFDTGEAVDTRLALPTFFITHLANAILAWLALGTI